MDLSKSDIEFFMKKFEEYLENEKVENEKVESDKNDMRLILKELIEGYHKLSEI